MDKRIIAIDNWVTVRYFKINDVQVYFRNLRYLQNCGIDISPSILISYSSRTRKTPDVFLCSGVDVKEAQKKIDSSKLLLTYSWTIDTNTIELISLDAILAALNTPYSEQHIFDLIAENLLQNTDEHVECELPDILQLKLI